MIRFIKHETDNCNCEPRDDKPVDEANSIEWLQENLALVTTEAIKLRDQLAERDTLIKNLRDTLEKLDARIHEYHILLTSNIKTDQAVFERKVSTMLNIGGRLEDMKQQVESLEKNKASETKPKMSDLTPEERKKRLLDTPKAKTLPRPHK